MRQAAPSIAFAVATLAALVAAWTPRGALAEPDAAASYDPCATARAAENAPLNPWATVPPMCYTRTAGVSNPCWTCHAGAVAPNNLADWPLQKEFSFAPAARKNPWTNLFVDRTKEIAAVSDAQILAWVRDDNYAPLLAAMQGRADYSGYAPDLDFAKGFDDEGFAKDGSGWRAVRYKPFPGTFWPTNGSADDTMIRLPTNFRADAAGRPSREIYKANLAILETSLCGDPFSFDKDVRRDVEPIDETAVGVDLDGDGKLAARVSTIVGLPARYVGGAADVAVARRLYPQGTEFLHSVRYLDPDAPGLASVRMKELRYARKERFLDATGVSQLYRKMRSVDDDDQAVVPEEPHHFEGDALTGLANDFGWRLQGFIEDASGRLRVQTREEHLFCMGCHTEAGVTVDQTFAFARKVPGADGWRPQDLRGMKDVPQVRHAEPEVLTYVRRVGGGDEFRGNDEFAARFVPDGRVAVAEILRAAPGGDRDLAWLLAPSRARALELDKAYLAIVRAQSFARGRDASARPARNVLSEVDERDRSTGLDQAKLVRRDGRIHLDWGWTPKR